MYLTVFTNLDNVTVQLHVQSACYESDQLPYFFILENHFCGALIFSQYCYVYYIYPGVTVDMTQLS